MLKPSDPCVVEVEPGSRGGVTVEIRIPTYLGGTILRTTIERDADGDWVVFLPAQPKTLVDVSTFDKTVLPEGETQYLTEDDYEVTNGILYLGAPDVERETEWQVVR